MRYVIEQKENFVNNVEKRNRDYAWFGTPQNTYPCLSMNSESQIYLDTVCNLLTTCQELSQALCAQHVSQGCLCQEEGGWVDIGDVSNGADSTVDPVVHHPIHLGGNGIFRENLHSSSVQN